MMKKYILILILMFMSTVAVNAQVAVIVNKSVSVDKISKDDLAKIYKLEMKKWSNGDKVVAFDLKDKSIADKVYSAFGMDSRQMKKLWMKKQLTGEGKAPKALGSENEVLSEVANNPGAIGFVSSSKVNDTVKKVFEIK